MHSGEQGLKHGLYSRAGFKRGFLWQFSDMKQGVLKSPVKRRVFDPRKVGNSQKQLGRKRGSNYLWTHNELGNSE